MKLSRFMVTDHTVPVTVSAFYPSSVQELCKNSLHNVRCLCTVPKSLFESSRTQKLHCCNDSNSNFFVLKFKIHHGIVLVQAGIPSGNCADN